MVVLIFSIRRVSDPARLRSGSSRFDIVRPGTESNGLQLLIVRH